MHKTKESAGNERKIDHHGFFIALWQQLPFHTQDNGRAWREGRDRK